VDEQRFVVMGAGEVGFHLARALSQQGHSVVVLDLDRRKLRRVEEELDVSAICGNGTHVPVLQAAAVDGCDLFLAVASSDEANLSAALMAKRMGAARTVVRLRAAETVYAHRKLYEDVFEADLLLSTNLLTTTRLLDQIRGHDAMAVEYFAEGKVHLRKIHIGEGSLLTRHQLRDLELPEKSLVAALFRGDELIIPSGDDRAETGDDALILASSDVINKVEQLLSGRRESLGTVVIAGGGETGFTVAEALKPFDVQVKIIERSLRRAEELAGCFPRWDVLHGDATDLSLLQSERVDQAQFFLALSGHDERNLMASLLAQELAVPRVLGVYDRAETLDLCRHLGMREIFSPRLLAYQRIHEYIENGYRSNLASLHGGAAQVIERQVLAGSAAADAALAELDLPRGVIVGAIVRNGEVLVPTGSDRLMAGDQVTLFLRREEVDKVHLLFPGREPLL
jgi:trk system potassium uptake protein TrkA